jgi:hypothetical protein
MAGWLALTLLMWGNSIPVQPPALGPRSAVPPFPFDAIARATPDGSVVRVRLYADGGVDEALSRRTQYAASALLSSAGVTNEWSICNSSEACPPTQEVVPIIVILSSKARTGGRENCGMAAHGTDHRQGSVVISVPCVAGVAFRLSRQSAMRGHPLLAMPRHDDLVGAVAAHEIGHLLGLRHAPRGLMRATLEAAEIMALRRGQLGFSQQEAARMRAVGQPTLAASHMDADRPEH